MSDGWHSDEANSLGLDPGELQVKVIRSPRRRRTLQARLRHGRIEVRVPADLDPAEEKRQVAELADRVRRQLAATEIDLTGRANALADQFDLPQPSRIEWSDRMEQRWGSCSIHTGHVRISSRLSQLPEWVVDYVIVHELAHLIEAGHGADFDLLVQRLPRAERARGYLQAISDLDARGLIGHPERREPPDPGVGEPGSR